jgi:hypothetical protein
LVNTFPATLAGEDTLWTERVTRIMMPEWSVESWDLHNLTLSRRTVGNSLGELRINS